MKKTKYILTALILGAFVQLTACGTEDGSVNQGQGDEYRTELTEDELKGGHVSFQMDENFVVDADVTGIEKYEKGLSSYYLKVFCETDKKSEKKFLQAPTLSLHGFEEWGEMLNKLLPGKFVDKSFQINKKDADIEQIYQRKDDISYSFHVNWSNYTRGVPEKTGFNTPVITIDAGKYQICNYAAMLRDYVQDYHGSGEAGFLQEADGDIERMKEFLQEMSGRSVYDGYDFCAVNNETIGMLNEQLSSEYEEPEEEYIVLYFYYDIDGLPFKPLTLRYVMENNETADELCYWSSLPGNKLTTMSEHAQVMIIGRDSGIVYLECSNMWNTGEVCEEKQPIISPNEALKQVKEHYGRQLLTEGDVVTNIELVYTGYFADGAGGKLQPAVSPVWVVEVYNRNIEAYEDFVYDGYTGDCILEGGH